jgi:PAS domain S-box-containing protein
MPDALPLESLITPVPVNETERLAALRRYKILDTPREPAFDRITTLAARLFKVPIALISLVDESRAWFKSCVGFGAQEVPRDDTLCSFAVLNDEPLIIPDARLDDRFACNPFVQSEPGVRFYAGAPLLTQDGFNLGTLCLLDTHPHEALTPEQQATLVDLAAMVVDELELRVASQQITQTNAALRASEELKQRILESSNDCIKVLNLDSEILYINTGGLCLLEINDPTLVLNSNWIEFWQGEYQQRGKTAIAAAKVGKMSQFQGNCPTRRGTSKWWDSVITPIRDASGQVVQLLAISRDITQQKQAEDMLRDSEERFRTMADHAPFMVWVTDPAGSCTYLSQSWYDFTGQTPETSSGCGWLDRTHPEDREAVQRVFLEANEQQEAFRLEYRLQNKDGKYIWAIDAATPWFDVEGQFKGYIGSVIDISDRKQAELEIQRFASLADNSTEFIGMCDLNFLPFYVNEAGMQLVGLDDVQQYQETPVREFFFSEDQDFIVNEFLPRVLREGRAEVEIRFRHFKTGEAVWMIYNVFFIRGENHQPIGLATVSRNITDRKQVEEALRNSAQRLALALAAAKLGNWSWDARTDVVTLSEQAAAIFGTPPGSFMTWTQIQTLLHSDDRARAQHQIEQAIAHHEDYDIEYRVIRPDGVQRWVAAKGRSQVDATAHLLGMLGVVQDITDRKQAEEIVRQSEERSRLAIRVAQLGLWRYDLNTDLVEIDERMREIWGELENTSVVPLSQVIERIHPDDRARVASAINVALDPGLSDLYEIDYRIVWDDGTERWLSVNGQATFSGEGASRQAVEFLGTALDITDRKQAESEREQLLQREQVARAEAERANRIKDEFLAVLSHELRSPLNPILGWTRLLQTGQMDEARQREALATIERNAKLQTQLIEDLLDISRIMQGKLSLTVAPVSLTFVITAAVETVRLAAEAKQIQILLDLTPVVTSVSGDAARLQQVVWNLLTNAVKFTPNGGQVTVELRQLDHLAQIRVIDTGKGISPDFLPHVFEYFRQADSTTTRKFGGLGLGLAIVRQLVEAHGGIVWAESEGENRGAIFTVRLPLNPQAAVSKSELPTDNVVTEAPLNNLQILLVDDEVDTREFEAFVLEQSGASVTAVASGVEALKALDQFTPDVLVSDIGMAEMDGYMLMQQIRARLDHQGGRVRAIALTAYARDTDQQKALEAGFQVHLTKPIDPQVLIKAISDLVIRA